jgi:epoxyqueuosine reductase QueG
MTISMDIFRQDLETLAREMGARAFGVADLDSLRKKIPGLLKLVGDDYSRAVVFGIRLQQAALESVTDKPTPIYFHNYRQVNYQLDGTACLVADKIQDAGHRALAVPASQIIRKDPMTGHISHKLLGWAAGIGFIGRNTLLVHPLYGAQMRYVSVLTDMPLAPDRPHTGDCGTCRACVEVCPARAIGGRREDFDLEACYEKLTEFTRMPFIGQHICGVCVKACDGKGGGSRG